MGRVIWTSPVASQAIVDGPEAALTPGKAVIRFRAEDGDEQQISFVDILKFVFTEMGSCSEQHLDAYDKLLDLGEDSQFAREAISAARHDASGYRHFLIFFDDVGAYDVMARSAQAS